MDFPPFDYYVKVRSCSSQESEQARKHPPASVDSERQDVVVEALLHHAEDLVLHGDLSALQALQTEQGDGRDRKRLAGRNEKKSSEVWGGYEAALVVALGGGCLPHHGHRLDGSSGEAGLTAHTG